MAELALESPQLFLIILAGKFRCIAVPILFVFSRHSAPNMIAGFAGDGRSTSPPNSLVPIIVAGQCDCAIRRSPATTGVSCSQCGRISYNARVRPC